MGSEEATHRKSGRPVGDAVRTPTEVSKISDTGEVTSFTMVGETGKFDETGVPRGAPPSGADPENYGLFA